MFTRELDFPFFFCIISPEGNRKFVESQVKVFDTVGASREQSFRFFNRFFFSGILSICFFLSIKAQTDSCNVQWNAAKQIGADSNFAVVPELIAAGDTIHLLWLGDCGIACPDSFRGIYYSHSFNGGKTFSTPTLIEPWIAVGRRGGGSPGELAVSGSNVYASYITGASNEPFYISLRCSTDAGMTWQPRQILTDYDPYPRGMTAHDSSVYLRFNNIDTASSYLRFEGNCSVSHDYGKSFTLVAQHLPWAPEDGTVGQNSLCYYHGTLHYVYEARLRYTNEIVYTQSTDFGTSWSNPDTLSTVDSFFSMTPRIAGGDDGHISVVWMDDKYGSVDGFHRSVLTRRSTDNGFTWENEQLLTYTPSALFPHISAYGRGLAVDWSEYISYARDRILTRISPDAGVTWCDTVQVDTTGGDVTSAINKSHMFIGWFQPYGDHRTYARIQVRRGILPLSLRGPFPLEPKLLQNYPNPFNSTTHIEYDLPAGTHIVTLTIYNILGQKISSLIDHEQQDEGIHQFDWAGENRASGVYFYKLVTEGFTTTKKLILMK